METIVDSAGTTRYEYDTLNRPLVITDALGATITQTYDLVGNRTQITYPPSAGSGQAGEVVTSTFDGDNRLLTVNAWDGGLTSYEYDSIGRMITMTLPNGVQSTALYDRANRLTQISHTAPGGLLLGQYQYQLDGNGLAQTVTETLRSPDIADLNAKFLESSGQVVMEAENGIATAGSSHAWQPQTTQQGYGGDSYLRSLPDIGDLDTVADLADSPHLAFPLQIATPATYTVWVRGMAPDAGGDSLHVGLDASTGSAQALTGFTPNEWSWASITLSNTQATVDLTASSTYTLDLWLREDGLRVDRILLITDTNYIPTGVGPAESPREVGSGSTLDTHTINYSYDPLNRLTAASYSGSLTANYGYEYDTLGNRMTYTATLTNSVVTTYTYNLANWLQTAKSDDTTTTWYYVYDNNGSRLQQIPGDLTPAAGAVQYSYDQSRRLVQVESHDGTDFQLQAEMVYDGRGNRLQAIAYANGNIITASYTLDPRSGLPLIVDNGTSRTIILYGQAAIGEYTTQWRYYLGDAQLSVRQLVDGAGTVTQAQTYAPYGVLLNQAGDGGGLFGYKGGQSSTNGLWYFGNGYFDPNTGQFISANGNPLSPLVAASPVGLLFAPILFIGWRRRKGKKRIHPATLLFLGVLLAATLSSCGSDPTPRPITVIAPPDPTAMPTLPPETEIPPVTSTPPPPNPTDDPPPAITPTPTCTPESPTPNPTQPPPPTPSLDYWADLARIEGWEVLEAGGKIKDVLDREDDALTMTRVAMGEGTQDIDQGHADRVDIMWTIRIRVLMAWSSISSNTPTNVKIETLDSGQYVTVEELYRVDNDQRALDSFFDPAALCSNGRNNLNLMVYPCSDQDVEWFRNAYMEAVTIVNAPLTQVPNYLRGYESNRGNIGPVDRPCHYETPGLLPNVRFRDKGSRFLDCHIKDNLMYP